MIKIEQAKPGQRQRALVLGRFEINEAETNWQHPYLNTLVPLVYVDRFYPQAENYLAYLAQRSLLSFMEGLKVGRPLAVSILEDVKTQREAFETLSVTEFLQITNRDLSFASFAKRIRLHEE